MIYVFPSLRGLLYAPECSLTRKVSGLLIFISAALFYGLNFLEYFHLTQAVTTEYRTGLILALALAITIAYEFSAETVSSMIGRLAVQVAHDIQSPLATLQLCFQGSEKFPEFERDLVRGATRRINEIAADLLDADTLINRVADFDLPPASDAHLVSDSVRFGVLEKKFQFKHDCKIEIVFFDTAFGSFAIVERAVLSRIISNLLNNAVESLPLQAGKIEAHICTRRDEVIIEISDSGRGIPAAVISKLGAKRFTFRKKGAGLGLVYAKKKLESWRGSLKISSLEGRGTTVRLTMPISKNPKWFPSSIIFDSNLTVIIVDDDHSTHRLFGARISELKHLELLHFFSMAEASRWTALNYHKKNVFYFIGSNFVGVREDQLNLSFEAKMSKKCILVSPREPNQPLQVLYARFGTKILPRDCISNVPIAVSYNGIIDVDIILIDDDSLTIDSWVVAAKKAGRKLRAFSSPELFFEEINFFRKEVEIFLDSNLGAKEKGEVLARRIFQAGFAKIYITSGYDPAFFKGMDHIKGVIGKTPPWL